MDFLILHDGWLPILSILMILPLAGAFLLFVIPGENFQKYWALGVTILTAAVSLPLYFRFDQTASYRGVGSRHRVHSSGHLLRRPRRFHARQASTSRSCRPQCTLVAEQE